MIIIFGIVILLVIAVLIYLSNQGHIHKNIPIIFAILILLASPFVYLARSKNIFEEDFSNPESLNIFYTNETTDKSIKKCGCPGICDHEKPDYHKNLIQSLEYVSNPVQSKLESREILPVIATIYSASANQGNGMTVMLSAPENKAYNNSKSVTFDEQRFYVITASTDQLLNFAKDKKPNKNNILDNVIPLNLFEKNMTDKLIETLDNVNPDSFIFFGTSGNIMTGITSAPPKNIYNLSTNYKFKLINQIQEGDSYAGVIYKKDNENYNEIVQEISPKTSSMGVMINNLNLLKKGKSYQIIMKGQEFDKMEDENMAHYNKMPFVRAEYVYIKPDDTSNDFNLVFTADNNDSFVYLSSRPDASTLYSESPEGKEPKSMTFLNLKQPQKWVIEPVYKSEFNDQFFIKTMTSPIYYLEVDITKPTPVLKCSLYRSGATQYWKIIPDSNNKSLFSIQNVKTKDYIGYNETSGYLYKDNANVMLVDTNKYLWKFKPSSSLKKNLPKASNIDFKFMDFTSPKDYPTVKNPGSSNIRKIINGKEVNLSTKGRSPWNKFYTPIWNGKWIYYGTVASYSNNSSIEKAKYLEINLNNNGEGTVNDPYFKMTISVMNAGSNYLYGYITDGKYKGYMATFEMLDSDLDYENPSKPYPVRMRYLITNNDNKVYNLSSGTIDNLNAYSMKFDGKYPGTAAVREMDGYPTLIDTKKGVGFPKL